MCLYHVQVFFLSGNRQNYNRQIIFSVKVYQILSFIGLTPELLFLPSSKNSLRNIDFPIVSTFVEGSGATDSSCTVAPVWMEVSDPKTFKNIKNYPISFVLTKVSSL